MALVELIVAARNQVVDSDCLTQCQQLHTPRCGLFTILPAQSHFKHGFAGAPERIIENMSGRVADCLSWLLMETLIVMFALRTDSIV